MFKYQRMDERQVLETNSNIKSLSTKHEVNISVAVEIGTTKNEERSSLNLSRVKQFIPSKLMFIEGCSLMLIIVLLFKSIPTLF